MTWKAEGFLSNAVSLMRDVVELGFEPVEQDDHRPEGCVGALKNLTTDVYNMENRYLLALRTREHPVTVPMPNIGAALMCPVVKPVVKRFVMPTNI